MYPECNLCHVRHAHSQLVEGALVAARDAGKISGSQRTQIDGCAPVSEQPVVDHSHTRVLQPLLQVTQIVLKSKSRSTKPFCAHVSVKIDLLRASQRHGVSRVRA